MLKFYVIDKDNPLSYNQFYKAEKGIQQHMYIRKSTLQDVNQLMKLYKNAKKFMIATGNPNQWNSTYPTRKLILADIESESSYVCELGGQIIATFYYANEEDETYTRIDAGQWLNHAPYGVVHRIATDSSIRGTAAFCLNWALEQCGSLKIDTHRDNVIMQRALEKSGFTYCGIIYLKDGSERLAYQKVC